MLFQSDLLIRQLLERRLAGGQAFFQRRSRQLAFRDVRWDGHVLPRLSIPSGEWDNGRIHPVNRAILGPVLDLAVPNLPICDGMVHLLEKLFGMVAGVEDAVVLADQFFFGILADRAELIVY